MTKQEYAEEVMKLLGLSPKSTHNSTGSTVTAEAWEDVYKKLMQWENTGILDIAKGLEKYK